MKSPKLELLTSIRERWFAKHVAELTELAPNIYRLVWAEPGTGIHKIIYTLDHGVLMVYGDLGEAIYVWGYRSQMSFAGIATFSLCYFHEKLQASEEGRSLYEFRFADAVAEIKESVEEHPHWAELLEGLDNIEQDEIALVAHLRECRVEIDGETLGGFIRAGKSIHPRVASHLIGIQMAVAQLEFAQLEAGKK